jgi:hypothetical protein
MGTLINQSNLPHSQAGNLMCFFLGCFGQRVGVKKKKTLYFFFSPPRRKKKFLKKYFFRLTNVELHACWKQVYISFKNTHLVTHPSMVIANYIPPWCEQGSW